MSPGFGILHVRIEFAQDFFDLFQEILIAQPSIEFLKRNLFQDGDGVMIGIPPYKVRERPENLVSFGVPCPPQVVGERVKTLGEGRVRCGFCSS